MALCQKGPFFLSFFFFSCSRNGRVEKTIILKRSFTCNKSNELSWGRKERERRQQVYNWKPKNVMNEKLGQGESHESNGQVTDTHGMPWPAAEACFQHCFSEEHTWTHCCHFIKFMEVVICKNKNYHKIICCILIIHRCVQNADRCVDPLELNALRRFNQIQFCKPFHWETLRLDMQSRNTKLWFQWRRVLAKSG